MWFGMSGEAAGLLHFQNQFENDWEAELVILLSVDAESYHLFRVQCEAQTYAGSGVATASDRATGRSRISLSRGGGSGAAACGCAALIGAGVPPDRSQCGGIAAHHAGAGDQPSRGGVLQQPGGGLYRAAADRPCRCCGGGGRSNCSPICRRHFAIWEMPCWKKNRSMQPRNLISVQSHFDQPTPRRLWDWETHFLKISASRRRQQCIAGHSNFGPI